MTGLHADEAFLDHYQFTHDPFVPRAPGFKFFAAQRKSIIGQLHHLARYSQLLLLITGPRGSGKTILRQALAASTNKQTVKSIVLTPQEGAVDAQAVLRQTAQQLQMAQLDLRSILAQIGQLAITGQEVYILVDAAEQFDDSALQALLALAAGDQVAHPHVFLFATAAAVPRLEQLSGGEERFHHVALDPYELEETREYLAQRLTAAGQDISLFDDEQIRAIHHESGGWPGRINEVARDVLQDSLLAEQNATRKPAGSFKLPIKHLAALLVVGAGVAGAWMMQNKTSAPVSDAPQSVQLPIEAPVSAAAPTKPESGAPTVEFAQGGQAVPLPLNAESAPVMREPLAQAAGQTEPEEPVADLSAQAPQSAQAPVVSTAPVTSVTPLGNAPVTAVSQTPAAVPVPAPAAKPAAVNPPAKAQAPVAKPATAKVAEAPKVPAKVATPTPPAAAKVAASAAQPSASWYQGQNREHFALQVFGTDSEAKAKAFVAQQGAQYRYYRKNWNGKPFYAVTFGSFTSAAAAKTAVKRLPAKVQASGSFPKKFASIQQEMAR